MKNEKESNKRKKIILIGLIIILLALITSCSCATNFFGKIGDWITNGGSVDIDDDTNEPEIITNQELKFDVDHVDMTESDIDIKVGYTYHTIHPKEFICKTSDPSVATCRAKDGYVIITPIKPGTVIVTLRTETNGKVYEATTTVTINETSKYIVLSSPNGTLNIKKSNTKTISYQLVGIAGDISAISSDENIATAIAEDGILTITALRTGNVKITLSLTDNGKKYAATYALEITEEKEGSSNSNKPGSSSKPNKPNKPNPSDPGTNEELDSNSKLSDLLIAGQKVNFNSNKYEYTIGVNENTNKIAVNAVPESNKATIKYILNGIEVSGPEFPLKTGDNILQVVVTAEDKTQSIYTIIINKAASTDNTLLSLSTNKGEMSPKFDKNILEYNVIVDETEMYIDVLSTLSNDLSRVSYRYMNQKVNSLNNLMLINDKSVAEIIVTSESGDERVYRVNIFKGQIKDNNYLSNIISKEYGLKEEFSKDKNEYTIDVPYNTDKITLEAVKEDESSTLSYRLKGEEISDLNNIPLKDTDTIVEIIVEAQNGEKNIYTVTIHKPTRDIIIEKELYTINIESGKAQIVYEVLEDGEKTDDYNIDDISVAIPDFDGTYTIHKGYIELDLKSSMVGKTYELICFYNGMYAKTQVYVTMIDYYLTTYANEYEVSLEQGKGSKDIILNTNMFVDNFIVTNIDGKIRLTSSTNNEIYIDISSDTPLVTISIDEESTKNSIVVTASSMKEVNANIKVEGYAHNKLVNNLNVLLKFITKYVVVLDANGGFYNSLANRYEFLLKKDEIIKLEEYPAIKANIEENCEYYSLLGYDENKDSENPGYLPTDEITITENITLYAIYSKDSEYQELEDENKLYLTEVDLFHNEEYFEKYGKDKIIYPGATGAYIMTFNNVISKEVTITGITLEEETICIDNKCLNMGYVIKYTSKTASSWHYYYGSENEYTILNKDGIKETDNMYKKQIVFDEPITIPEDESIEISLLWKWTESEATDSIDTEIGKYAAESEKDEFYKLRVSIDFTSANKHCEINKE